MKKFALLLSSAVLLSTVALSQAEISISGDGIRFGDRGRRDYRSDRYDRERYRDNREGDRLVSSSREVITERDGDRTIITRRTYLQRDGDRVVKETRERIDR